MDLQKSTVQMTEVLFRKRRHHGDGTHVFVVPKQMRHDALRTCHDLPLAGHQGVEKTCSLLKQRFHWAGMVDDVLKYVKSCPQCQMRKIVRKPTAGFLHSLPITGPFETTAMDSLGPFRRTPDGNVYACVITDFLTKYTVAGPLPD